MSSAADAPAPLVYYDRSTGLMVFGFLTVGLGFLAALMVALMIVGQLMSAQFHQPGLTPMPFSALVPAIAIYVGLSVALVWLGIGSCLCRRWARALLCLFSWSWLVVGVCAITAAAFILPGTMANAMSASSQMHGRPAPPGAAVDAVLVITFVIYGVIFVALPAAWTFFYNSRHVKATCDFRDPVPRWTDRCPLPVLAVCVWAAFSVPSMLVMAACGHIVMPVFGFLAAGLIGSLFYLLMAVIWAICGVLVYRLDVRGWWLLLGTMVIMLLSSLITYSFHSLDEMYRLMGYPEDQVQLISRMGLFKGHTLVWFSIAFFVPVLGYLIYIKRYFVVR